MDADAPPLVLEPPDGPRGQMAVAARYGVSVRTVKRWVAAGREHNDLPPLDSPVDLLRWAQRMNGLRASGFARDLPVEIERAAAEARAALPVQTVDAPRPPARRKAPRADEPATESADDPEVQHGIDFESWDPNSVNFDDVVAAAKKDFVVQESLLRQALESGNKDRIRSARVSFREASDLLREVERDRQKIMVDRGLLLRRDDVRRAIQAAHSAIPTTFKARLRESWSQLAQHAESRAIWDQFVDATVDDVCRRLIENQFAA